jgi:phenylacetate-CoA ligase
MVVQVEVNQDVFSDTVGGLEQLQTRLTKSIESTTGLRPRVRLIQPHSIPRSEGKAKRVIDKRNM